jgi:hypothetical protein
MVAIDNHVTVVFENGRELVGEAVIESPVLFDGLVGFLVVVVYVSLKSYYIGVGFFYAVQKGKFLCLHLQDKENRR